MKSALSQEIKVYGKFVPLCNMGDSCLLVNRTYGFHYHDDLQTGENWRIALIGVQGRTKVLTVASGERLRTDSKEVDARVDTQLLWRGAL